MFPGLRECSRFPALPPERQGASLCPREWLTWRQRALVFWCPGLGLASRMAPALPLEVPPQFHKSDQLVRKWRTEAPLR